MPTGRRARRTAGELARARAPPRGRPRSRSTATARRQPEALFDGALRDARRGRSARSRSTTLLRAVRRRSSPDAGRGRDRPSRSCCSTSPTRTRRRPRSASSSTTAAGRAGEGVDAGDRSRSSASLGDADGADDGGRRLARSSCCASRPATSPDSLAGQLRYVRDHWGWLLGSPSTTSPTGSLAGDRRPRRGGARPPPSGSARGGGPAPAEAPSFAGADARPSGSPRTATGCPASSSSRRAPTSGSTSCRAATAARSGRSTRSPTRSSTALARRGITGLWLIGLWQRSRASERIKRWRGDADAVASAYSLDDYRIADDLGGDAAARRPARPGRRPRDPAGERHGPEPHGDRLALGHRASGPVHVGSASRRSRRTRSTAANLADDRRVEIRIEDHY